MKIIACLNFPRLTQCKRHQERYQMREAGRSDARSVAELHEHGNEVGDKADGADIGAGKELK